MGELDDLLASIGDDRIPGGCGRCDAYQTVEEAGPGVTILRVHHDGWCPFLRSTKAGGN